MIRSSTSLISSAVRKPLSDLGIWFILASMFWTAAALAEDPPPDLAKRIAARESATRAARNQYTYRQTVQLQELDKNGASRGEYKEVRDVIFSPEKERTEQMIGSPLPTAEFSLTRRRLTPMRKRRGGDNCAHHRFRTNSVRSTSPLIPS